MRMDYDSDRVCVEWRSEEQANNSRARHDVLQLLEVMNDESVVVVQLIQYRKHRMNLLYSSSHP